MTQGFLKERVVYLQYVQAVLNVPHTMVGEATL